MCMHVLFINNDGGGFAGKIEIEPQTTVDQLFQQRLPGCRSEDYLIRVNRQHCVAGQFLCEGDRVSITPIKIEGARR